MHDVKNP